MVGIFRTNISTVQDKHKVIGAILSAFNVTACSVDIEDCDRVLRIVSAQIVREDAIMSFVKRLGYHCDVLE